MLFKKDSEKKINYKSLNELIELGKIILKVMVVFLVVSGVYAGLLLTKELKILDTIFTILGIISPLFIGIVIAWLFDPFVSWMQKKGLKRGLGTTITYLILVLGLYLFLGTLIPVLSDQINDFVKSIPSTIDSIKSWLEGVFNNFKGIEGFDIETFKTDLFTRIGSFGTGLTDSLPELTVKLVKSLFSGIGVFIVGLVIGFYLLLAFDNISDMLIGLLPKKIRDDAKDLSSLANISLRRYVNGALIDALLIFVVCSIGFAIIGLKAPLVFGLFCGLTNIIPYVGPYIGGAPAVIVGLSQSTPIGILALVIICIVQFLEGNFLQALIMSKTTKLHPVTIMLGLLVFGYFFGILGMIISTPLIAVSKTVFMFFNKKYNFLRIYSENED